MFVICRVSSGEHWRNWFKFVNLKVFFFSSFAVEEPDSDSDNQSDTESKFATLNVAFTPITRSTRSVSVTNLQLNSQFHNWWSDIICFSAILNIMSTLSFQRPSLLYTPPDLGSPSQKSSAADVAVGTLISFSPWERDRGGGGEWRLCTFPTHPTVSNSHQSCTAV